MKKVIAVLWYAFMFLPFLSAQNYQAFNRNCIAYFSNVYGGITCIRIDSVGFEGDSVLYPFRNIREIYYDCYTPYGPSWIGEKIVVNDSMNLFFNQHQDTIKIKTGARMNESWLAYELPDSMKVVATVIGMDTMTFLGQVDSVKTIGFQAYDRTMKDILLAVNSMTIKISKKFGCIKILNFVEFPDQLEYGIFEDPLMEYDLIGLSEPETGVQNLTWFEVNDFQPGDELHVVDESTCISPDNNYSNSEKTITKYLSRVDYPDSIVYETWKESINHSSWNNETTSRYTGDTVRSVIKPNLFFDKLPGEPIIYSDVAFAYGMHNGDQLVKTEAPGDMHIYSHYDSCWSFPISDGCTPQNNYYKGLGGPYYYCMESFMCIGESYRKLVYYKKGNITWGTPMVISDISEVEESHGIEIYPNPAQESITVKASSSDLPFTIEIIDISGRIIMRQDIRSETSILGIDERVNGVYLYRITVNGKKVFRGKLRVE